MSKHHLKVTVDPARCVTYGRCAAVAPGVFMIDQETNKAYFEEDEIGDVSAQTIFAAARACPTGAIQVEQFGRRLHPQVLPPMPGSGAYTRRDDDEERSEQPGNLTGEAEATLEEG